MNRREGGWNKKEWIGRDEKDFDRYKKGEGKVDNDNRKWNVGGYGNIRKCDSDGIWKENLRWREGRGKER